MSTTTTPQPFDGTYEVSTDGYTVSVEAHTGEVVRTLVRFVGSGNSNGDDPHHTDSDEATYQQELATAGYFAASKKMYEALELAYALLGLTVERAFPELHTMMKDALAEARREVKK